MMHDSTRRRFLTGAAYGLAATALAAHLPCAFAQNNRGKNDKPNKNDNGTGGKGPGPKSKKGAAGGGINGKELAARLKALKLDWTYNWGRSNSNSSRTYPDTIEYVPMIWGTKKPIADACREVKAHKDQFKYMLGFNEPDHSDQSNMTVEAALAAWPTLMDVGLPLGSPAPAVYKDKWMREFMKKAEAKKYRIDFVCVHLYDKPDAGKYIKALTEAHKMYDRPIWLTEFSASQYNKKFSSNDVVKFLHELLPQLNKLHFVHRYCWFSTSLEHPSEKHIAKFGPAAFFDKDGKITEVGQAYASL